MVVPFLLVMRQSESFNMKGEGREGSTATSGGGGAGGGGNIFENPQSGGIKTVRRDGGEERIEKRCKLMTFHLTSSRHLMKYGISG